MLRIVVRNGDSIKIGEDILIKSMTDGRVSLAVDAPKKYKIERMGSDADMKVGIQRNTKATHSQDSLDDRA